MAELTICLGGDIVPTNINQRQFCSGNINELIDEGLQRILANSDANIFNLETPLCDELSPILKCGPNLHAPVDCVNGLQAMHITALGCANNHTLDQGEDAMFQTKRLCNEQDIDVFGIGRNLQEAAKPYIVEKYGKKVGIYACAEHEFTVATDNRAGANPYDALYSFDHVASLKSSCDYVIVMFHGGKEYYRYPSPNIRRICRRFVEKGADLVVTQHTHCIGCREDYQSGVIVYGQGNFLFEQSAFGNREFYSNGLLLKIVFNENVRLEELPVILKENGSLSLAKGEEKEAIMAGYKKRSLEIKKSDFIQKSYDNFARSHIEGYLRVPLGYLNSNLILRIINRLVGRKLFFWITNRRQRLSTLNIVECEAHRELFIRGLKSIIYKE
ncbi:MAG: CapA family protein [Butyrivibrio sp.]|nr:CapA family protein [Butyrivibrio sp.]